jgi:hypothetical protein
MLFFTSDIQTKKKPPAGMLATEVRSGDAPKHTFPMKTDEKSNQSGKNTQTLFFEQK